MFLDKNNVKILTQLGLTVNQAKTYLALSKTRVATAKELSKSSSICAQDIYRIIPSLEELGLVEKVITSPSVFRAISPDKAIQSLLMGKEKEYLFLQKETLRLIKEISKNTENTSEQQEKVKFSLISEKEAILEKSRHAISHAISSICVLTCCDNFAKNSFHFLGISKRLINSSQISIRMLLYAPDKETPTIQKLVMQSIEDPRFEVRLVFQEKPILFSVFDREQVFFSTKKVILGTGPLLWSNNPSFVAFAQDYFDLLWTSAVPLENKKNAACS